MVVIKSVSAKSILDSRKEKTIHVTIKTDVGNFSASAPNGNQEENMRQSLIRKV